jgi:hypothetical protein
MCDLAFAVPWNQRAAERVLLLRNPVVKRAAENQEPPMKMCSHTQYWPHVPPLPRLSKSNQDEVACSLMTDL